MESASSCMASKDELNVTVNDLGWSLNWVVRNGGFFFFGLIMN